MNELAKRTLSAIVAAVFLIAVLAFAPVKGILCLSIIIVAIGFIEYLVATGLDKNLKQLGVFIAVLFLPIILFNNVMTTVALTISAIVILFTAVLWLNRSNENIAETFKLLGQLLFGIFYCILCPLFVIQLTGTKTGNLLFLGLMLIVFSNDIFAYLGGKVIGKTPFMPNVSPKKSIEGSITGCCGAIIVSYLYFSHLNLPQVNLLGMIAMTLPITFMAQTGDLFASLIKRIYGIKDFGKIMPGHGGVIDRLDGVYFASPIYWATLYFMSNPIL